MSLSIAAIHQILEDGLMALCCCWSASQHSPTIETYRSIAFYVIPNHTPVYIPPLAILLPNSPTYLLAVPISHGDKILS